MKLYRGSVHLSRLVDSDIFLHLVGRVGLLNGRDWFRVCRSDSLIGALWVYLTGEGGRRVGGEEKGRDYMASSYTLWKEFSKENKTVNKRSSLMYVVAGRQSY